ncbi:hypothetical protein Lepto7375DRAFT_7392 [Leptolyngbya sp. PCC 7375]|nr:hypothetical protein Lepto7375DRAFT_7392 [Leptolyngbya sp. PCC 7375]
MPPEMLALPIVAFFLWTFKGPLQDGDDRRSGRSNGGMPQDRIEQLYQSRGRD